MSNAPNFAALLAAELKKAGVDPSAIPPAPAPDPTLSFKAKVKATYQIGGAAACTAVGFPELAPLCSGAAGALADGVNGLVDLISGGDHAALIAFFTPDPSAQQRADTEKAVRLAFWDYYASSLDLLQNIQSTLKISKPLTRAQIAGELYNKAGGGLLVVRTPIWSPAITIGPYAKPGHWIPGCDPELDGPHCVNDDVGVPRMDFGTDKGIEQARVWPNLFAQVVAAEGAAMIAKAIVENRLKKPSFGGGVFVTSSPGSGAVSSTRKSSGGGGMVVGLLALSALGLYALKRRS